MTDPSSDSKNKKDSKEQRVNLETSHMKTSYCNVCNATSTRDEVVLSFGLNQNWERSDGNLDIDLQHRVILSPYAAKKLHDIVGSLLEEYEKRYGALKN
jgi:hypothetical protein